MQTELTAPQRAKLKQQIDEWQKELVNLTRRNRLLYFKHTKSATLEITSPKPDAIWAGLQNGGWKFYSMAEPEETAADAEQIPSPHPPPHTDELVTNKTKPTDLKNAIRNLERKSNQAYIDTGLRVLYACFHVLRWIDPNDGKPVESPILLYPVEIERGSLQADARVVASDGDPVINPSLVIKMQADFGLDLGLSDDDFLEPVTVRSSIATAIADHPEWKIEDRVIVGTFTFHREAMYKDLVDNATKAENEPLIQALAIGPAISEVHDFGFDALTDDEIDQKAPAEQLVSIGDADSTQRACIVAARDGKTFVMDGPPGTGKSQTIANMIAELMTAGKSVLFVSEKAAALDVVYQRLQRVGLHDFVLELHSHKATRKEVAHEFGRALTTRPTANNRFGEQEAENLRRARQELNDYAIALNKVRLPLGRSLHKTIGRSISLHNRPSLPTPDIDPASFSAERFSEVMAAAGTLSRSWGPVDRGDDFLWKGIKEHQLAGGARRDLESALDNALSDVDTLTQRMQFVENDLGLSWPLSHPDAGRLLQLLELLEASNTRRSIPTSWLSGDSLVPIEETAISAKAAIETLVAAETEAEALAPGAWMRTPLDLADRLSDVDAKKAAVHPVLTVPESATQDWWQQAAALLPQAQTAAASIREHADTIRQAFGVSATDDSPEGLAGLAELGQMVNSATRPEPTWLNPVLQSALTEAETVIKALVTDYRERREQASQVFKPSVLELDLASLKTRMQEASGFGKLSGSHRTDKKTLAPHLTTGKVKKSSIAALDNALAWQQVSRSLDTAETVHSGTLGSYYPGRDLADLDRLDSALSLARRALAITSSNPSTELATQIATGGNPSGAALASGQELQRQLDQWNPIAERIAELSPESANLPLAILERWIQVAKPFADAAGELVGNVNTELGTHLGLDTMRDLETQLGHVRSAQHEIESSSEQWSASLGPTYSGRDTEFDTLTKELAWAGSVREAIGGSVSPAEAERVLALPNHGDGLLAAVKQSQTSWAAILDHFDTTERVRLAADFDVSFTDARHLLTELRASTADIDEWNRHADANEQLESFGLGTQAQALANGGVTADDVQETIERCVLEGWSDRVIADNSDLRPISAVERNSLAERFRDLDRAQVNHAAARVINGCSALRPNTAAGAAGTIQREATKKSRHMPIRKLLDDTREVALKLKPCFMMSPLTVSQFLPSDLVFDAVIFDEASQVKPSEAVNCLYRGRQVIVAGDPKQLPPTSFFQSAASDDSDEYDEDATEDFESVLDGFRSSGIPMMPLSWHYRSQHEALITFSNYQFYDGRLHTFPGAIDKAPDVGVELIKADGVYQRGGGSDNPIEAQKVVERVLFHRQNHPDDTIGVVAFSSAQESAIQNEIEVQAVDHPELNELLTADRLDGFFVKNLENVQGDERDIIIFSIGYGKDENGKFTEGMGPLNRAGGERRLNVAITRARRRVEVVASITAGDFPGTSQARGVRELQKYLAFAETGMAALAIDLGETGADVESPFEEEVLRTINRLGFSATPQVGVAGYRIDLGVRNPDKPGEYVLAVECDGAAYHSSKVARDRDRLRQQVIENLGWSVHRIWGPSWYQNRQAEEQSLLSAIHRSLSADHEPVHRKSSPLNDAITMSYEEASLDETPEWVNEYQIADFHHPWYGDASDFADPATLGEIVDVIGQIIAVEAPIHEELLRLRTMEKFGIARMGNRIRDAYINAYDAAIKSKGLVIEHRTIVTTGDGSSMVRVPGDDPESSRIAGHVPPSEQQRAIINLVEDSIRIERTELLQRFARLFGWQRAGTDIRRSFDRQLDELIELGVLSETGNVITLA